MSTFAKGIRTGLFISRPAEPGVPAALSTATLAVQNTSLPAGSEFISVRHNHGAPFTLQAGSLLQIAGTQFVVIVTADTVVYSGQNAQLPIVQEDGTPGTPIALIRNSVLTWDRLYRVHGTSSTDLGVTEATQDRTSVVHDVNSGPLPWTELTVTSKSWTMDRRGNFKPNDPAYLHAELAALEGREVYVRRVLPDEDERRTRVQQGRALIFNLRVSSPADGIITASWEFKGQGALLSTTWPPPPPTSEFSMLDFRERAHAINLTFTYH